MQGACGRPKVDLCDFLAFWRGPTLTQNWKEEGSKDYNFLRWVIVNEKKTTYALCKKAVQCHLADSQGISVWFSSPRFLSASSSSIIWFSLHCSSITPVIPLLPGSYTDKHKHRRAYKTFEEGRIINLIIGLVKHRSLTLVLQLYVAAKFIYL